jgi:DNA-binding transcriptional ArsR family regulator
MRFDVQALAATRLSTSPAMEALAWLTLTATARRHPVFGDPGPVARGALRHPDVALIVDLIPPDGRLYFTDLLTPKPRTGSWQQILHTQIAEIESTAQDHINTRVFSRPQVHGGHPTSRRVRRLAEAGRLQERLALGIARFWRTALHDDWPALQAVLDNDLADRAKEVATHGIGHVLGNVHPRTTWTGDSLIIDTPHEHSIELHGHGPAIAATVLGPSLMVQFEDLSQVTLYYPANRIGSTGRRGRGTLTEVLGAVRAALLSDLGCPRSTAELVRRHAVAASTVSYHLTALHRAGLVTRRRDGRYVLYQRTPRADILCEHA